MYIKFGVACDLHSRLFRKSQRTQGIALCPIYREVDTELFIFAVG